MPNSKRIAGLVGPTLVAMLVSEFPLVQPHLYDAQIPPVVYLSGVLCSSAGSRSCARTSISEARRGRALRYSWRWKACCWSSGSS
jgi:hypothetical protein